MDKRLCLPSLLGLPLVGLLPWVETLKDGDDTYHDGFDYDKGGKRMIFNDNKQA